MSNLVSGRVQFILSEEASCYFTFHIVFVLGMKMQAKHFFTFHIVFVLDMKMQAKYFYMFLVLRRSTPVKMQAMELSPGCRPNSLASSQRQTEIWLCTDPEGQFLVMYLLLTWAFAPDSSPDPCAWPMPCPAHLYLLSYLGQRA